MSEGLIEIVQWPDGTWCLRDEFDYERDWAWKSDDYNVVSITWSQLAFLERGEEVSE